MAWPTAATPWRGVEKVNHIIMKKPLFTDLIPRQTVADYCALREQAIVEYADLHRRWSALEQRLRAVERYAGSQAGPAKRLEEFTRDLDRTLWRHVLDQTEIPRFMDAQARREFEAELERDTPPFTEETVRSTLVSAASQTDEMFARGLYNLFCERSDRYLTNAREPFRLPRKVVWEYMIDTMMVRYCNELRLAYGRRDKLNDLDRVFRTLAGLPYQPGALATALSEVLIQGGDVFEDELFRMRGFRNGNLHVWFLQQPLVDRANRIIAAYAGAVIPDARAA
jgi:hypothetical protein